MTQHTLYIIEMVFKITLAIIVIDFIIYYFLTEIKLNNYKDELKKKVDTKKRIEKMNKNTIGGKK